MRLSKAGEAELGQSGLSQTQAGISGEGEPRAISLLQKIQGRLFCLLYTLAEKRKIALGSAKKCTVRFFSFFGEILQNLLRKISLSKKKKKKKLCLCKISLSAKFLSLLIV